MGLRYTNFFDESKYESCETQIIVCKECSCHLCLTDLVISDDFQGSSGQAYLVESIINYVPDKVLRESNMKTGVYLTRDVKCHQCKIRLGWTYQKAYSYLETYKEGKFVIEKSFIKFITNNSSTKLLLEQADRNNRRRLSANSTTSTISEASLDENTKIDNFRFISNPISEHKPRSLSQRSDSFDFRDIQNGTFLRRLRFQGMDKDDIDEDEDVFVDV